MKRISLATAVQAGRSPRSRVHGPDRDGSEGFGRQKGHTSHRGAEYVVDFLPKMKIEVVAARRSTRIDAVIGAARTGKIGDGAIFVSDVERVIRIRTGEENEAASAARRGSHKAGPPENGAIPGWVPHRYPAAA